MGIVNLWDPKTDERSKSRTTGPSMGPKKERANRPVWSVDVEFEGKVIKDFPLTYIIKHNNPWIYFEVLKTLNPPIMSIDTTPQQATTGTGTEGSLIARFTSAVNQAIDTKLVPIDPQYANAKVYFTTLSQRLHHAANKNTSGIPGGIGEDDSDDNDFMKFVVRQHADAMARVPPNSPAWNAIRENILRDLNKSNLIADEDGTANAIQQRNIKARDGIIRQIIIDSLRAQGLLR